MAPRNVLLVQCCDLPQFFFAAKQLRNQHPDWSISALVHEHAQIHFYLERFPFSEVHWQRNRDEDLSRYQTVILPLLNQGYLSAKCKTWSIKAERLEIDYQGNLRPLSALGVGLSLFRSRHHPDRNFTDFLRSFPLPELNGEVLLVESCHPSLVEAARPSLEALLGDNCSVSKVSTGSFTQHWKPLRQRRFDAAIVYCSTEKGYLGLRLLPFLLRIPNIWIVNENAFLLSANARGLMRFLYSRFIYGAHFAHPSPRILLWQTEGVEYMLAAWRSLKSLPRFRDASALLVCSQKDRPALEGSGDFAEIVTWRKGLGYGQVRALRQRIKSFAPDFNCALFTGRPVFRKQKIACFLLGSRQKLAINANLDSFWLTVRSFHRIFKKERLLYGLSGPSRVLLLESSGREEMRSAAKTILQPKVVPEAHITLFCRNDRRNLLEGLQKDTRTITYSKESLAHNLGSVWKILRFRPDVLAAVFSGTRIYPKHRLLFWLIPARSRLAFNRHLDCFYVDRRSIFNLFPDAPGLSASPFRKALRGVLFLPRLLYLLCWWAANKRGLVRHR